MDGWTTMFQLENISNKQTTKHFGAGRSGLYACKTKLIN